MEMEPFRLWILSGNHREFEYYDRLFKMRVPLNDLRSHRFKTIYLSHPEKLHGHRKGKWIRVGTWYERRTRELNEILELLHILEFEEYRSDIVDKEEEERREYYERRDILYHENIPPIKVPKNIKIWGQKDLKEFWYHPVEFITEEEMTI